jgi:diguanylate cyclase (GGDEF)-like protein
MTPQLSNELLLPLADTLSSGIVLLDPDRRICLWNRWMSEHSGIPAVTATGRELAELFPDIDQYSRLEYALRSAYWHQLPSLLSQSLNKAPLALFTGHGKAQHRVQQQIKVMPLLVSGQRPFCLLQVDDVSDAVNREHKLRKQAQVLQQQSHIDGLTGIANRRHFDEFLRTELRRSLRNNTAIALLMIDVDYFKAYNDSHGHLSGDQCLITIAQTLVDSIRRPGDLVARYGGEEFAVVLAENHLESAATLGEQFRQRVAALRIAHPASAIAEHVTVSVGATSIVPIQGDQPESLICLADFALYEAKRGGRDRVVAVSRETLAQAQTNVA